MRSGDETNSWQTVLVDRYHFRVHIEARTCMHHEYPLSLTPAQSKDKASSMKLILVLVDLPCIEL